MASQRLSEERQNEAGNQPQASAITGVQKKPFTFNWSDLYGLEQFAYYNDRVDWDAIVDAIKSLSGSSTCVFESDLHGFSRHLVRRVRVGDQLWLVRMRHIHGTWTKEDKFRMESEIATMKFVAQRTDVPVPKVYGYDTRSAAEGNPAKLPYMLVECIEGNMMYIVRKPKDIGAEDWLDYTGMEFFTDEENVKLRKTLASVQCKLGQATVDKIGSFVMTSDGDGIDIGPLPEQFGFKGPFTSPADYFKSWGTSQGEFKSAGTEGQMRPGQEFPRRLASEIDGIIEKLGPAVLSREFAVVHPNLAPSKFLFDDDLNLVGVVDWENAFTAPIGVFAVLANMHYINLDFLTAEAILEGKAGREYAQHVVSLEKDITPSKRISATFGSIFGDLALSMFHWQYGKHVRYDRVLDRGKKLGGKKALLRRLRMEI